VFTIIPTGRKYTSTARSEFAREYICEKCATEFTYKFMVSGSGTQPRKELATLLRR